MLSYAFTPAAEPAQLRAVPLTMEVVALALAALSILLGFTAEELTGLLRASTVLLPSAVKIGGVP
jgi:hypothetical protein